MNKIINNIYIVILYLVMEICIGLISQIIFIDHFESTAIKIIIMFSFMFFFFAMYSILCVGRRINYLYIITKRKILKLIVKKLFFC